MKCSFEKYIKKSYVLSMHIQRMQYILKNSNLFYWNVQYENCVFLPHKTAFRECIKKLRISKHYLRLISKVHCNNVTDYVIISLEVCI